MKKKILSIVACVAFVASVAITTVYAADNESKTFDVTRSASHSTMITQQEGDVSSADFSFTKGGLTASDKMRCDARLNAHGYYAKAYAEIVRESGVSVEDEGETSALVVVASATADGGLWNKTKSALATIEAGQLPSDTTTVSFSSK